MQCKKEIKRTINFLWCWYVILSISMLLGGCGKEEPTYLLQDSMPETQAELLSEQETEQRQEPTSEQSVCFVHICGAVKNPGVYELATGSRIYDAIVLAGGLREDANDSYQNQAAVVTDGMQIYIPTKSEAQPAPDNRKSNLVNINTADLTQLMTLSGIGESRAKSIIAYREKHGSFSSKEEIMKVSGIKEGAYEKIKDAICVN